MAFTPKFASSVPPEQTALKQGLSDIALSGKTYVTSTGATIQLPDSVVKSPTLAKALESGGLTLVENMPTEATQNLTASGITIKPIYYVLAIVALVTGYFIYKKFKK